jgi:hypothetical protein
MKNETKYQEIYQIDSNKTSPFDKINDYIDPLNIS